MNKIIILIYINQLDMPDLWMDCLCVQKGAL